MRTLILTLFLTACGSDTDTDPIIEDLDTGEVEVSNDDPNVNSYMPANYRAESPTTLIFMGDSITAGDGASPRSEKYSALLEENVDSAWPDYGEVDIQSLFPSIEQIIDVSKGGATTRTLVNSQLSTLSNELGASVSGETIVVMTIGGNDMQAAIPAVLFGGDAAADEAIEKVESNLHKMVDYFEDTTRFPDGVFVYIANVYEPTAGTGYWSSCFGGLDIGSTMDNLADANDAMRAFSIERDIAMIDLQGHFFSHGFYHDDDSMEAYNEEDPTLWFANDCIHPNNRGHHEVRRLFHATIDGKPLQRE
jgi:lysophospholipase L1-like esterase